MEELLSVTICDPLDFDENIFLSWLRGLKSAEAAEAHINAVAKYWTQDMDNEGSNIFSISQQKASGLYDLLQHEIMDHYESYEFLEHYVCQPWLLTNQIMIRIPDHVIQWVICQYYTLDNQVARSLFGKRLFKNRRELEDISENCHIPLISVTRQFENMHRIYQSLEDLQFQVNFKGFIESTYALPSDISKKYACLLFLVAGRFDVNSKKRLQRLSCMELENCAAASMACLLPDLQTFLSFNRNSLDVENLDCLSESELQDMHYLNVPSRRQLSLISEESTSDPLLLPYSYSGSNENNKPRSQKGSFEENSDFPRPLSMGRSQSAPPKSAVKVDISAKGQLDAIDEEKVFSLWIGISKLLEHPSVFATEPDKQLLANLRELRSMFTSDLIDTAIACLKKIIISMGRGEIIIRKLEGRMKSILKSLINIGGHLSQSKEYRDIYDDILNIVGENLQEAGLDRYEANLFLIACNSTVASIKDVLFRKYDRLENAKKQRKINTIEMDWIRFVLCCRICLWNMFDVLI